VSSAVDAEDTNIKTGDTRYRGRIAKSEQTRDEHLEVLADHITDVQRWIAERESGEVKP
jgi:predicted transcriptional regulator